MKATHAYPNFDGWPAIAEWHVDDSVLYGTYKYTYDIAEGAKFFASRATLFDLSDYRETQRREGQPTTPKKTIREEVLEEARSLCVGDREEQYGTPYSHFSEVAEALNAFDFSGPGGRKIMPEDIPFFQMVVKLSRILKTPDKRDSWVDIAGYAALGYEVVTHNE